VIRKSSTGCNADFRGYPLGKKEDSRCIEFIACIGGTIISKYGKTGKIDPWVMSGFSTDKNNKSIVQRY
jgi:hypothetical protein